MKHAVAALILALTATGAWGATEIPFPPDRIVVPADSPVRYSGLRVKDGEQIAAFSGKFLLTGTYYFGDNDFNDSGEEHPSDYVFEPQAYIIPDTDIAARLPRFAIRNGRPFIFLSNPVAFAKAVVPKAMARRVRCRKCGDATGHIAIWVDRYSAGIVCDAPAYDARFLSVANPIKTAIVPAPDRPC